MVNFIQTVRSVAIYIIRNGAEHPEFKKCWALENLQPLEAEKNISKSNKYEG